MKTFSVRLLVLSTILLAASAPAQAVETFTPTSFSAFTDSAVQSLVQTVGIGGDHHAYMAATPLGVAFGLDVGLDVTYIMFPTAFTEAMSLATGQTAAAIPAGAPLPKLNIHKGLPWGLDIGGSFSTIPDSSNPGSSLFTSYGLDLKWAFIRGMSRPSIAVRLAGSYNSLYFIRTRTYSMDVLISKNLSILDPYFGVGLQYWGGDLSIPVTAAGLPLSISASQSGVSPHIFGGLSLKLLILRLTAQADYSTTGVTTLGGKVSFGF